MIHAVAHRGPDGQGSLFAGHAALGHCRLAIIDLEKGGQPISTADGLCAIVFNGEIYNYRELREALIRKGERFATHSDTEVILRLYLSEGRKGFSKLRGMYAFALWDGKRNLGLLARDPAGIKPLFLHQGVNGELAFGSEAKAILAGGVKAELDESSLHLLMNLRYLPGERTLFRHIRQLAPGTVLEWNRDGGVSEYSVDLPVAGVSEDIGQSLRRSVEMHLVSDVEVGAYLSGGMDSAAIAALAVSLGRSNMRTFTLGVGDDPDEARNAAETARMLGLSNLLGESRRNPADSLSTLIRHLELPKVNAWQVSELAGFTASYVKVVLSGLGGDELFYGYNLHSLLAKAHALSCYMPRWLGRVLGDTAASGIARSSALSWTEPERACRTLASLGKWPRVYALLRNVWDDPRLRRQIYGPRMLDSALPDAFDTVEAHWPDCPDPVEAAARFEWRQKMVNDLLWQEDRSSMAVGLEVRVPFVDTHLAAAVGAYGRDRLMPGGRRKAYMKEMLSEVLPSEVLNRPKSGFQVDASAFFKDMLEPLASYWLSDERVRHYGLFNPDFIRQVRREAPRKGVRWHYFLLYLMLTTHLWCDLFEQNR